MRNPPTTANTRTASINVFHAARLLLVVLAVVTMMLASSVESAHALSETRRSGSHGTIDIPAQLTAYSFCTYLTGPVYTGCVYSPAIAGPNTRAYRSAAHPGSQIVTVDYHRWLWRDGRWVHQGTQRREGTIATNSTSVLLTGMDQFIQSGYTSITATITWWRADTRQPLGSIDVSWNGASDYVCRTQGYLRCQVGPGWVHLS
jgi:hypothetical protein